MRKWPLSASRLSSAATSGTDKAPGGTGPGFAHPLKCDVVNYQLPTSKPQIPNPKSQIPNPKSQIPTRALRPELESRYHRSMPRNSHVASRAGVGARLCAFVLERFPFALPLVRPLVASGEPLDRASFDKALRRALSEIDPRELPDTTPHVTATARLEQATSALLDACDGFIAREEIAASLTVDERREILRGMVLTRAIDNRLKQLFTGGEVQHRGVPFQGKGFRSLGQEAIFAAGIRLRRGPRWRDEDGTWRGDVVGPIIRDLGVALAMRPEPATVRMVLNAQMGKDGPPMGGKDLHLGDLSWGILPATAPLSISTLSVAGMAMAFAREGSGRVAVSFIGEGGSSLGEWHEAVNLCAARRLPAIFCIENNQTALSTPLTDQSAVRAFADKAVGYGIPGITIDGTDPDGIAAAFTWAADRARQGAGPALIELVTLRMCGHAHHDDMLYLGKEAAPGWESTRVAGGADAYREVDGFGSTKDPIATYAAALEAGGIIKAGVLDRVKRDAEALVKAEAQAI